MCPWTDARRISRRRLLGLAWPAAAAVCCGLSGCSTQLHLVAAHQRRSEVYARTPVSPGTVISHSWIHSIELSRWSDFYRVEPDRLVLSKTEFSEYGAGMPLDEGDLRLTDGKIVIENIDRDFTAIRWFHSHRAQYRIGVDGDLRVIDAGSLPDREPLELRLEN